MSTNSDSPVPSARLASVKKKLAVAVHSGESQVALAMSSADAEALLNALQVQDQFLGVVATEALKGILGDAPAPEAAQRIAEALNAEADREIGRLQDRIDQLERALFRAKTGEPVPADDPVTNSWWALVDRLKAAEAEIEQMKARNEDSPVP